MSTAIIDLCDDSSSDEDRNVEFSIARRIKPLAKRPVIHKKKAAAAPPTPLQVWDSSDDDDLVLGDSSPTKKTKRNARRESQVVTPEHLKTLDHNDSDSHDAKPKRRPPRTLFSPPTNKSTKSSSSSLWTPIGNNDNTKKKKKSKSPMTCLLDDSDSEDDEIDLLLSCQDGVFQSSNKRAAGNTSCMATSTAVLVSNPPSKPAPTSACTKDSSSATITSHITTSKAYNPYRKQNASTVVQQPSHKTNNTTCTIPNIGAGRMHYEDIRPRMILALSNYARTLVHASYNLTKLDSYCKKINALALSEFPIRSVEEYTQRFCRTAHAAQIKEALSQGGYNNMKKNQPICNSNNNNSRQYFSIAEACLVGMYQTLSQTGKQQGLSLESSNNTDEIATFLQQKTSWIYLLDLLPAIDRHLKPCSTKISVATDDDNGAAFYTEPSTRSAEYKQVEKLASDGYIKYHKQNSRVCYELTSKGCQTATQVMQRCFPAPNGYYRTSHCHSESTTIWLAVDHREGGGGSKQLHTMCDTLDRVRIPYLVTKLDIGDYCFFTADGKLLPILVERKSIQDVAQSIHDGRWTSQKWRMYQGQYVFGYEACRLAYIIEGAIEPQQVTGGYIGDRQFNVSRERLEGALELLESEGFDVLRTNNTKHSLSELARWANRVSKECMDGTIQAEFTLDEFLRKVRAIPNTIDFSRIAKDNYRERRHPSADNNIRPVATKTRIDDFMQQTTKAKPATKKETNKNSHNNTMFQSMKLSELKKKCEEWGLPKTGTKDVLIARLQGPRPPEAWLKRKSMGLYVPTRHDTCGTAILVGLWLQQRQQPSDWTGMSKDELYTVAESLQISRDPFTGVAGGGPHAYDGWSAMPSLKEGEAPLVFRNKGGYFKLTSSNELAGMSLAEAMHEWCHAHNRCECQQTMTL